MNSDDSILDFYRPHPRRISPKPVAPANPRTQRLHRAMATELSRWTRWAEEQGELERLNARLRAEGQEKRLRDEAGYRDVIKLFRRPEPYARPVSEQYKPDIAAIARCYEKPRR